MFGGSPDEAFLNDATAARAAATGRRPWGLLLAIAAGIALFIVWAATFEIEEVTSGQGRVIPSGRVQVVQSLEGGIVQDIAVLEGQAVAAGDPLIEIDDTGFSAALGELRARQTAYLAEEARLSAEATMAEDVVFPDGLETTAPLAVLAEREVFLSRRDQLAREIAVLEDQLRQREAALVELRAEREKLVAVTAPLSAEVELTEDLVARGIAPQVELLRLKSRLAELDGDLAIGRASEPRLQASIQEARNQIGAARSAYVLTARQNLAEVRLERAVVEEELRAASDRVSRAVLTSPVDGTVNRIHPTTLGAVVQPGAPLIEIVPTNDSLLIEVDITPRDIAFIRPGDAASVKITAYDFLVYGALDGTVLRLGADAIEDRDGQAFFRAVIQTDRTFLGTENAPLPISPGMIAGVDIQTGQRTVLSYLAKPLLRARAEALRER